MQYNDQKYVPPHLRSIQETAMSKPSSPKLMMDLANKMELKSIISDAIKKPLVKGDVWYLCDRAWFDKFKRYTGVSDLGSDSDSSSDSDTDKFGERSSCHPGQIDLSSINSKEYTRLPLKSYDYIAIHEKGWKRLVEEFGIKEGQRPMRREVINKRAPKQAELEVEVNLLKLKFVQSDKMDCVQMAHCSRNRTLRMYCDC